MARGRSTSVAVLGVQVELAKLYNTKITRSSNCDHTVEDNHKFCPECGKAAWDTSKTPIEAWNYQQSTFDHKFDLTINKMYNVAYIGFTAKTNDNEPDRFVKFGVTPDLEKFKVQLERSLAPYGLWNEMMFGLWSVLIQ